MYKLRSETGSGNFISNSKSAEASFVVGMKMIEASTLSWILWLFVYGIAGK